MSIKDLFFKITARDQTGGAFASVNRRLRETDGLTASVSERMGRAGRSMQRFGAVGSVATLGVAAAFRDVIGLYDQQQRAEAKVAQAVRQTGAAAGFAADELYEQASALQDITRFGDEDILNNVTAQLLTFKNISGEAFTGAQTAALDLATVLDGDLKSASIMLGKALNDPAQGLSAMSRAGVTFSEEQKEVIKRLAETGGIAEAQRLILEEIASAYGGQAAAAREAGAGTVDAWRNTWGDLKEDVGAALIGILPPIVDALESITGWFRDLEPEGQKVVVMLGALAIAIPPVTAAIGLMAVGVSALMGPVGLIVGGIAALVAGTALLWPEQDKAVQSTDLLTGALGDEITQAQLLTEVIGSNARMSVEMAKKKLTEAQARHENVKAIIAENRALAMKSTEYQGLVAEIADLENVLTSAGVDTENLVIGPGADAYQAAKSRLAALRQQRERLLEIGEEEAAQLARTEENIAALEEALAKAEDGFVKFGDGMIVPIEAARRLKEELGGDGGLNDKLKELPEAANAAAKAEGWDTIKDNLRALVADGQSWSETWDGIFGAVLDRLFDLAFSPAWDQLFDNLSEYFDLSGKSAGGGGGLIGGLVGQVFSGIGNILGLDSGGDVTVSGKAGIDRNLTVLRTSDSERVSVRRQGDTGGGGAPVNVYIQTPDPQAFQASRAQIGHQIARAVAAGNRAA